MAKLYNYEDYLESPVQPVITIEQCEEIYNEMKESIDLNDEDMVELLDELLEKCFNYAMMRMNWSLYTREEKMDKDSLRTSRHDTVITSFNMLSRYLEMNGKKAGWREKLGENRKCIGDFACYLAFIQAINNR